MVVGDPRQLRFVSFVADVDVADTLRRHGLDDRVDVRRLSAFDVAAGAASVSWLDQHYRSAPHLIEFSARRFYGDRMALVTRHPRNEASDVIDVIRVPDATVADGVNAAEVDEVIATVRALVRAGEVGIGVITPFRAQADALEAALIGAFDLAAIERVRLRVGTVHSYQGSESDLVVASLGLGDGNDAVGLVCAVHPAGPDAHIERHRELVLAGWRLVEAYPSRWASNAARAAVALTASGTAAAADGQPPEAAAGASSAAPRPRAARLPRPATPP
jgi:hypothetical protein